MQTGFSSGRIYLLFVVIGLVLAGVSLLHPSQLSYDSWSWLGWGREIIHGRLNLAGSTSWKPLPVIFTTVFALFGSAAPDLWLVVARGAAVVGVLMSLKLAIRLAWQLSEGVRAVPGAAVRAAPPVLAGAIVIASMFEVLGGQGQNPPSVFGQASIGTSESLVIAAILIAAESAYDGSHRRAFLVGLIPALDRPEIWIVWMPYGIWQMRRDPLMRALVPASVLLAFGLWFVPQKLGGQSFTSGLKLATTHHTNQVQLAGCPVCTDWTKVAWPLVGMQIRYTSLAATLVGIPSLWSVVRKRTAFGDWTAIQRATIVLSVIAITGWLWILGMVAETGDGLSGSQRYMLPGAALLEIACALFFAWAAINTANAFAHHWRRSGRQAGTRSGRRPLIAATAVAGAAFLLLPFWFGDRVTSIPVAHSVFDYDAQVHSQTTAALAALGGADRLAHCGTIVSESYAVPMLAFYLDIPARAIRADGTQNNVKRKPHIGRGKWPAVIAQYRYTRGEQWAPARAQIAKWVRASGNSYHVVRGSDVRFYVDCR